MGTMAQATAAPVEFQLHGKTVMLHPLNFREWGMIERWMREEIISVAKESLKDRSLSEPAMRILMSEAQRHALRVSIHSADALEGMLSSLEGMLRVVHLSLRKGDDKLTLEKVDDLLANDMQALAGMMEKVYEVSFPEQYIAMKGGDSAENPPKAKPAKAPST